MAVITSAYEYEAAQAELRHMEEWLARIHREEPNPQGGLTKMSIRKMIARLHEELGRYESRLSVAAAGDRLQAAPQKSIGTEFPITTDEPVG